MIAITAICLMSLFYFSNSRPSAQEMKDYFLERQSAFEGKNAELLSAISENREIEKGTDEHVGYQWLKLTYEPNIQIRYYTDSLGIGVGSFGTGLAYLQSPPDKTYPDFESMYDDARRVEGFIGYTHILDNWYSFLWGSN